MSDRSPPQEMERLCNDVDEDVAAAEGVFNALLLLMLLLAPIPLLEKVDTETDLLC